MWDIIKRVFGFSGVGETTLKIVEKMTGTDDSPDKKREFLLAYIEATKHQSPVRRLIATIVLLIWTVLIMCWLTANIIGRFLYDEAINPGTVLAADISAFMDLNVNVYVGMTMAFYFTMHITTGLKNKQVTM